jgi:hypothetical protein
MEKILAHATAQTRKFDSSNIIVTFTTLRWLVFILIGLLGLGDFAGHDVKLLTLEKNNRCGFLCEK